MRKVAASLFISLDGVAESPDKWQFDSFNDDMMAAMSADMAAQDTVLMGRVTYQEWLAYWPTSSDEPFASYINNVPKVVVSTALEQVTWQNSSLVSDVKKTVNKLKKQPGETIGVVGSPTLVESLLQLGLLDELKLMIHPVVAGRGKRLFQDGRALKRLKLVESKTTRTGVIIAVYQGVRA
jgi:dihydrofolate reductase